MNKLTCFGKRIKLVFLRRDNEQCDRSNHGAKRDYVHYSAWQFGILLCREYNSDFSFSVRHGHRHVRHGHRHVRRHVRRHGHRHGHRRDYGRDGQMIL